MCTWSSQEFFFCCCSTSQLPCRATCQCCECAVREARIILRTRGFGCKSRLKKRITWALNPSHNTGLKIPVWWRRAVLPSLPWVVCFISFSFLHLEESQPHILLLPRLLSPQDTDCSLKQRIAQKEFTTRTLPHTSCPQEEF